MSKYSKAIVSVLAAGLTAAAAAVTDGQITPQEWITIALAALSTGAAVWAVPNKRSGE